MKKMKIYVVGFFLLMAANSFAQESPAKRGLSLSIGPELAIPVGTFRNGYITESGRTDGYKAGFGGSVKLYVPVASNIDVSISAGYMAFSAKGLGMIDSISIDKNSYTFVPFKGGIRFRTNSGLYLEPQAGYTQTKIKNMEGSGQFTYAANVGYLIGKAVDVAVRYEAVATKGTSAKFIGLRLAYNIPFARVKG